MTVHVLIPVHNRAATTLACLSLLQNQTYPNIRVVVVDDGSTDGTGEMVMGQYPGTEVIRGDGDLWWTGAMRVGVERILETAQEDDFVLAMNDDITFGEGLVSTLVETSVANGRAVTAPLCHEFGTDYYVVDGGCVTWRMFKNGHSMPTFPVGGELPDTVRLDFAFGRATLIPVVVFREVGNYNSRALPHYGGDTEFTYRAGKAGFRVIACAKALVEVDETGAYAGVHHAGGRRISLFRAFSILFSMKSRYQLSMRYRLMDLICPRRFRPMNKLMQTVECVSYAFGKTEPFVAAGLVIKYLKAPFPIPACEFKKNSLEPERYIKDGVLSPVSFRGREFYRLKVPPETLPKIDSGLLALYNQSLRLTTKLRWLIGSV